MALDRRDLRLFRAIVALAAVGSACLALGLWFLVTGVPEEMPVQAQAAPVGGVVAGVIFLGLALGELVHRLRRGPQSAGRRTR